MLQYYKRNVTQRKCLRISRCTFTRIYQLSYDNMSPIVHPHVYINYRTVIEENGKKLYRDLHLPGGGQGGITMLWYEAFPFLDENVAFLL